jgi:cobalamin biosynthesis protein CobT
MSNLKLKLYHEEVIKEEGIEMSDLPLEIKKKIKGFDLMKKRWEKNPEGERGEREFIQLQKQSTKIGDMIIDFIESDFDEDEEKEEEDRTDKSENENDKSSKNNNKKDKEDEDEDEDDDKSSNKDGEKKQIKENRIRKTPQTGKFGNLMMEKKILSIMEARGDKRIRISDLEAIIGREPDYPEQTVNNIVLRKVFLASDYRLL